MNALSHLSATELSRKLKSLVTDEKKITTEILWHLREVERRKLYLEWAYPSLFEYCVKNLGYSESAAQRRILAMRLLKEMPEIADALNTGALHLSQVAKAQEYFRKEEKSGNPLDLQEKGALLHSMVGKSTRECDRIIAAKNPELSVPKKKERVLTAELTELRIVVSKELLNKMDRLKEIKSNVNPNLKYSELLELLVDGELKKQNAKIASKAPDQIREQKKSEMAAQSEVTAQQNPVSPSPSPSPPAPEVKSRSRFIAANLKRAIYIRDRGACTFKDSETARICGSRHQLQIDHIIPLALGGQTTLENLRLLCRQHNLQEAVRTFGTKKIAQYMPGRVHGGND